MISDLANLVYDSSLGKLLGALVCLSTSPFHYFIDAAVPSIDSSAGGTPARHYEVGTLREVPVPADSFKKHAEVGAKLFRYAEARYSSDETTNYFSGLPALCSGSSLRDASAVEERLRLGAQVDAIELHLSSEREFIGDYGLDDAAIKAVYDYVGPHPATLPREELSQLVAPEDVWKLSEEQLASLLVATYGGKRRFSKQTWIGGREIELWAYTTNLAPSELFSLLQADAEFTQRNASDYAKRVLSFLLGVVIGRWDIRYATGERSSPELPDPFAPLPACPPGMLQGDDRLPLSPEAGRRLQTETSYPLEVAWDGILPDDRDHPFDVESRIHAVFAVLWGNRVDELESEACELLGVSNLREWISRPSGLFADHLRRYRRAVARPLSTGHFRLPRGATQSGTDYHRLSAETLYSCVNNYVEPKLEELSRYIGSLRSVKNSTHLSDAQEFREELEAFKAELLFWAPKWKPNLNDGVLITACPLFKLFRLPKWRKKLRGLLEGISSVVITTGRTSPIRCGLTECARNAGATNPSQSPMG